MAQITISKQLRNWTGKEVEFSRVTELINTVISENPNYNITSSVVLPITSSEIAGGTTIISKTLGYDCCFILTEKSN